jgi:hypothetical protein
MTERITGWRFVLAVGFIFFFVWMAAFGTFATFLWVKDVFWKPVPIASERTKSAMKYHGIIYAECVGDKCGFWRDGEWVRL